MAQMPLSRRTVVFKELEAFPRKRCDAICETDGGMRAIKADLSLPIFAAFDEGWGVGRGAHDR